MVFWIQDRIVTPKVGKTGITQCSDQHRSRFLDFTLTDIGATVLPAPLKYLRPEHLHVIRVTVTVIHDELDLGPIELDCVSNWLGDKNSAIAGRLHTVQGDI